MVEYEIPTIDPEIQLREKPELFGWASMWRGNECVGTARWCCACESWFDVMNSYVEGLGDLVSKGANCNEFGDWKCYRCAYVEKRPNRTDRTVVADSIEIPTEYADATINELKPVHKAIVAKWGTGYPFMVVHGIPGSGKTRVAWAFVKKYIQDKKHLTVIDGATAQRSWVSCPDHNQREKMAVNWESCWALILDDLSVCIPSDAWAKVIHTLIDRRRLARRRTMITTAANADELQVKYGQAIHSRLNEFEWVHLPAKDHRAPKGELFDPPPAGSVGGSSK